MPAAAPAPSFTRTPAGLRCTRAGTLIDLVWYGDGLVRVRAWRGGEPPAGTPMVVVAKPLNAVALTITEQDGALTAAGPGATVRIAADGTLRFAVPDGRVVLVEAVGGRAFPANALGRRGIPHGCAQRWKLTLDESLYGLGQHQDGRLDWRGRSCTLLQSNDVVAVPFLWSTAGWGILWDNGGHTVFADDAAGMRLASDAAAGVDYCVVLGATPARLIAGYRALTGRASLLPRWALGFWQSRERYKTAVELRETVAEFRRRGLPLDVIVQDWQWWGGNERWSSMEVDTAGFGDFAGAIAAIHGDDVRVLASIWPIIGADCALAKTFAAAGQLFDARTWNGGRIYDAWDPAARATYWAAAKRGLWDIGVDGWWMDATEPEWGDGHDPLDCHAKALADHDSAAGPLAPILNTYVLATCAGVDEGQQAAAPARRTCILTRSGFAGQQRHGAITWSGDITASWDCLRRQVAAGLDFCMAGVPWWTTDAGAFFITQRGGVFGKEANRDPAYRELYLRWMQWAAVCPIMRSHGTETEREPWFFGAPGEWSYDGLVDALALRYRLLPYLEALHGESGHRDGTPMRPLAYDFPGDRRARRVADQLMLGPALMACPMLRPVRHAAPDEPCVEPEREAWLPTGRWRDFWTGAVYEGGRVQRLAAPLGRLPLLLRAGAILPLGPRRTWTGDQPGAPVELRIAAGADGACDLYEDAGDGDGWTRGECAWIPLRWDDGRRRLTIGARQGGFPGLRAERRFRIVVVREGRGCGLAEDGEVAVTYTGRELAVAL